MNKKRLSVVMAGAMLASSVSPVLAADALKAEEIAYSQRGLLIEALQNKMATKYEVGKYAGESVYGVKVGNGSYTYDVNTMITQIKAATAGTEIVLQERGYATNKDGKVTDAAQETILGEVEKFDHKSLEDLIGDSKGSGTTEEQKYKNNKFVEKVEWVDPAKEDAVKVTLHVLDEKLNTKIVFNLVNGEDKIDLSKPLDANDKPLTVTSDAEVQKFAKFALKRETNINVGDSLVPAKNKDIAKYVLKGDSKNEFLVSDLFDGLMLTEKGNEILETLKAYPSSTEVNDTSAATGKEYYEVSTVEPLDVATKTFKFTITLKADTVKANTINDKVIKTITVKGTNKTVAASGQKEIDVLQDWFAKEKFNVGKLAGEDRYATAAKIAKEQADLKTVADGGHIVLVNGNALVDGLSAAPLAQALVTGNEADGTPKAAPVLLTEKDRLPSATKSYIKELIAAIPVGSVKNITIDLVGGEGVLSESLVDELKDYGFKVKRYGGETREETSLIVADAIARKGAINNVYVVGAKGEADAMSIAPIASTESNKGAIIVSNFEGLSKDALREIDGYTNANITIVGGDGCVSASDEAKLKEIAKENNKKAERVAGSDRKATNAAIIEKFYAGSNGINGINNVKAFVIAKDDVLVDALTAANLASKLNAPILLATNELSNEQINQVNLNANNSKALYQVGEGVNTKLVEKLANLFKLPAKIR